MSYKDTDIRDLVGPPRSSPPANIIDPDYSPSKDWYMSGKPHCTAPPAELA